MSIFLPEDFTQPSSTVTKTVLQLKYSSKHRCSPRNPSKFLEGTAILQLARASNAVTGSSTFDAHRLQQCSPKPSYAMAAPPKISIISLRSHLNRLCYTLAYINIHALQNHACSKLPIQSYRDRLTTCKLDGSFFWPCNSTAAQSTQAKK